MNDGHSSVDIVMDRRIDRTTPAIAFRVDEATWRLDRAAYNRIRARRIGRGAVQAIDRASTPGPEVQSVQRVLTAGAREGERRRDVHAQGRPSRPGRLTMVRITALVLERFQLPCSNR